MGHKLRKTCQYLSVLIIILFSLTNCDREKEFIFDIGNLVDVNWGIPQLIQTGMEPFPLDAPTIFNASGFVTIGGSRIDTWYTFGERSIILEQARQRWFIIDLRPDRLYVDVLTHPQGEFVAKVLFEPL